MFVLNIWLIRQETLKVEPKTCLNWTCLRQKLCSWKWSIPKISHDDVTFFKAWTDNTSPCSLRGRCKKRGGEKSAEGKRQRQSPIPSLFVPPLPLPRRIITIRYKTYLSQTFLSSPYWSVNDFEEKLSRARIEDKDGAVDWFRGQVTFERLEWKHTGKR